MDTEVTEEDIGALFKLTILKLISELHSRKVKFQALYDDTRCDVYKRVVRYIEQKIKMLEELL
jgi:hypothetical protein